MLLISVPLLKFFLEPSNEMLWVAPKNREIITAGKRILDHFWISPSELKKHSPAPLKLGYANFQFPLISYVDWQMDGKHCSL
jgi:hypothetical protein